MSFNIELPFAIGERIENNDGNGHIVGEVFSYSINQNGAFATIELEDKRDYNLIRAIPVESLAEHFSKVEDKKVYEKK